jgi:hypothetical protein
MPHEKTFIHKGSEANDITDMNYPRFVNGDAYDVEISDHE